MSYREMFSKLERLLEKPGAVMTVAVDGVEIARVDAAAVADWPRPTIISERTALNHRRILAKITSAWTSTAAIAAAAGVDINTASRWLTTLQQRGKVESIIRRGDRGRAGRERLWRRKEAA